MKETDSGVKHPCRRMISASCSWVTCHHNNNITKTPRIRCTRTQFCRRNATTTTQTKPTERQSSLWSPDPLHTAATDHEKTPSLAQRILQKSVRTQGKQTHQQQSHYQKPSRSAYKWPVNKKNGRGAPTKNKNKDPLKRLFQQRNRRIAAGFVPVFTEPCSLISEGKGYK